MTASLENAIVSKTKSRLPGVLTRLVSDSWLDFAVSHVDPLFSVSRTKARVVSIRKETVDAVSVELLPNANWTGFVPGQFLPVKLSIKGVLHERCYSLTGEPTAETVRITVKKQANGLVSRYINEDLVVGDIIEIGAAGGDFVLPQPIPTKLLYIAGGSGITPVYSMIKAALKASPFADIVLAYYGRSYTDFIFLDELEGLKAKHAGLRIQLCITGERMFPEDLVGRFTPAQLQGYCYDHAGRESFVCGPAGLIEAVMAHYQELGLEHRLHKEYFGLPPVEKDPNASAEVTYSKSGVTVETKAATLLAAAEEAGLKPKFGCRMGICNTCSCTKKEGVVRNVLTGEIDDTPNAQIRICVSEPLSAVTLDI